MLKGKFVKYNPKSKLWTAEKDDSYYLTQGHDIFGNFKRIKVKKINYDRAIGRDILRASFTTPEEYNNGLNSQMDIVTCKLEGAENSSLEYNFNWDKLFSSNPKRVLQYEDEFLETICDLKKDKFQHLFDELRNRYSNSMPESDANEFCLTPEFIYLNPGLGWICGVSGR